MSTKEVETPLRPVLGLVGELADRASQVTDDAMRTEISAQFIDRVMTAETADEVFDAAKQDLKSGQDMVNVEHKPVRITVRPSGKKGGLGAYLVVECVLRSGEEDVFGIGAATAVAQYVKLEKIGYDGWVVIRGKGTNTDGNEVLYLEAA